MQSVELRLTSRSSNCPSICAFDFGTESPTSGREADLLAFRNALSGDDLPLEEGLAASLPVGSLCKDEGFNTDPVGAERFLDGDARLSAFPSGRRVGDAIIIGELTEDRDG